MVGSLLSIVVFRIGAYVCFIEEYWPFPLLFGILDDEVKFVEVWQFYFDFVIAFDEFDSLIGCHETFLHHFCLLQL